MRRDRLYLAPGQEGFTPSWNCLFPACAFARRVQAKRVTKETKTAAFLLVLATGCTTAAPPSDQHSHMLDAAYDCAEMCPRADLGRCLAWIGSDLTKPGVCMELCRGVGPERLHCRLFADTCADTYLCYPMLQ